VPIGGRDLLAGLKVLPEVDVTIPDGPFAGGTTMHASYMLLRLDTWYGQLSERERVARTYAPQVTPEEVSLLSQSVTRYGVIGHAQTSARARRAGTPVILRRDFDTADGGLAPAASATEVSSSTRPSLRQTAVEIRADAGTFPPAERTSTTWNVQLSPRRSPPRALAARTRHDRPERAIRR
jgi:hypothetical protein